MWVEFEEALIDRSKFLDIQRGVVDSPRRARGRLLISSQSPKGSKQVAVRKGIDVEILRGEQLTVEHRQPQCRGHRPIAQTRLRLILDQQQPQYAERLPKVILIGKRSPLFEQPTQPGNSIVLAVQRIGTQKAAVFRNQKEQKAIDKDQNLAIKPIGSYPLVAGTSERDTSAQFIIGWVAQETMTGPSTTP